MNEKTYPAYVMVNILVTKSDILLNSNYKALVI